MHAMISPYSRCPGQATNRVPCQRTLSPHGQTNRPGKWCLPGPTGKGKGPGQRRRTGVRPVGNGLGLRCLLGARALSRPNPLSSRISAAGSLSPSHAAPASGRLDADALRRDVAPNPTTLSVRLASPVLD